jgi:glycosyltransferase involved in cell wall biosynthesis
MSRVAWFSPMPPLPTGIARYSADLISSLGAAHALDVYVDQQNLVGLAPVDGARTVGSAHDFVWRHREHPYDLVVYQLGNSSLHDFQWPYLFRYPGLVVLHDAHLHHARAACLLRTFRADDYREEFVRNHPEADADLAELAVAGFDSFLHYAWPMTRLVVRSARMVAVHAPLVAERLRQENPDARIDVVRMAHGTRLTDVTAGVLGAQTRVQYQVPADAFVFGCFGGLTPDKRIDRVLSAFAAVRPGIPQAHLLLAGHLAADSDARAAIADHGLSDYVTITGYLPTDEAFTGCIAAADVGLCLRWPTAREVSGPWLRCLAAGKPTVTIDLAHLAAVPSVDPRTWLSLHPDGQPPCTVAIDILDEDHSLRLAMRRLAADPDLRAALGKAAREYWSTHHNHEAMSTDYLRVMAEAMHHTPPPQPLPDHLVNTADGTLRQVLHTLGVPLPFAV